MRALGVDPSSSATGIAFVDHDMPPHDVLIHKETFTTDTKLTLEKNMNNLLVLLVDLGNTVWKPEIVIVEKVSVSWNVNTIRKIAYFEAVAMLAADHWSARLFQPQATKARNRVFGKGNMSKEACWDKVKEDWPRGNWKTMDETDAFVLALAGPALLSEA